MKKLNIIVTTIGGLTSPDILKAIREITNYDITIIGTDPFEFAVGRKFVDIFEITPYSGKDEKEFINVINELVKKYKVDLIIPCGNEDNLALAKYKNVVDCKIMVSNYDDLVIAYDKAKVYEVLKNNLPDHAPKYYIVNNYQDFIKAINKLGYPNRKVVIKPRFGRGGRGVYVLREYLNFKDIFNSKPSNEYPLEFFENILSKEKIFDELIVMEYLVEPFYSIYSICKDGENIFTLTHIREWGNASQTFRGRVYYDEKLENIAAKIIKSFNLSYTNNMELATSIDGRIVLFDLNPRIGASSGIDREIGFNFPLEAINLLFGKEIKVNKEKFISQKIFMRYFDQVWI